MIPLSDKFGSEMMYHNSYFVNIHLLFQRPGVALQWLTVPRTGVAKCPEHHPTVGDSSSPTDIWRGCEANPQKGTFTIIYQSLLLWRFPEIGVPLNFDLDLPWFARVKPTILGYPHLIKKGHQSQALKLSGNTTPSPYLAPRLHASWHVPHPRSSTCLRAEIWGKGQPLKKRWISLV